MCEDSLKDYKEQQKTLAVHVKEEALIKKAREEMKKVETLKQRLRQSAFGAGVILNTLSSSKDEIVKKLKDSVVAETPVEISVCEEEPSRVQRRKKKKKKKKLARIQKEEDIIDWDNLNPERSLTFHQQEEESKPEKRPFEEIYTALMTKYQPKDSNEANEDFSRISFWDKLTSCFA